MKRRIPKYAALLTMLSLGLTVAFVIGATGSHRHRGTGKLHEGGSKLDFSAEGAIIITAGSPITCVAIKAETTASISRQ